MEQSKYATQTWERDCTSVRHSSDAVWQSPFFCLQAELLVYAMQLVPVSFHHMAWCK